MKRHHTPAPAGAQSANLENIQQETQAQPLTPKAALMRFREELHTVHNCVCSLRFLGTLNATVLAANSVELGWLVKSASLLFGHSKTTLYALLPQAMPAYEDAVHTLSHQLEDASLSLDAAVAMAVYLQEEEDNTEAVGHLMQALISLIADFNNHCQNLLHTLEGQGIEVIWPVPEQNQHQHTV